MDSELERITVGGVDLLVVSVVVPGSENTGALDRAGASVLGSLDRAHDAVVQVAQRVAATVKELSVRSIHPDEVQVEFGLTFGTNGNIIIAGADVQASLKFTITYNGDPTSMPGGPIAPSVCTDISRSVIDS